MPVSFSLHISPGTSHNKENEYREEYAMNPNEELLNGIYQNAEMGKEDHCAADQGNQ